MSKINKNIWLGIEALAAGLDGNRKDGEEILDQLEADLKKLGLNERNEMRRKMIPVAQTEFFCRRFGCHERNST